VSDRTIAKRYASAMLRIADETGNLATLDQDMDNLSAFFAGEGKELYAAICNPAFAHEERLGVLNAVLPKLGLSNETGNLLKVLVESDRIKLFALMVEDFTAGSDQRLGRVRVDVTAASELDSSTEAQVRQAFEKATNKTIVLTTKVDPDILGGLIARMGGTVYDASVRSRLEDIKQRLLNTQLVAEA